MGVPPSPAFAGIGSNLPPPRGKELATGNLTQRPALEAQYAAGNDSGLRM